MAPTGSRWSTSDLDVGLTVDNEVVVEDEDEFELHQVSYGYTPEMIETAISATEDVVRMLEAGEEPFFEVAETWLGKVN